MQNSHNAHAQTVEGFGDEWERFDQRPLHETELRKLFESYFSIFPWEMLPENAIGCDIGCGSGRWAKLVAPRVHTLHCIDASEKALRVAQRNLTSYDNCRLHVASVGALPFADNSMDFGYSLGVLHHVPRTEEAITLCVSKLKVGAPFLLYLYYAFDNRPLWFKALWRVSDSVRRVVSTLPWRARYWVSQVFALCVYYPLARSAAVVERLGVDVDVFPLSTYRHSSFYVMRNDALDRLGTALEQRFTKAQVRQMMKRAGLQNICFSTRQPYWCAVGYKG